MIKRILGVDPGLSTFGWAYLRRRRNIGRRLISHGLFTTKPDKSLEYFNDFYRRLDLLEAWFAGLVREIEPEAIAVEAFSYPRQARAAVYLAGSHSALRSVARSFDIPLLQIRRTTVLQAIGFHTTGRGRNARRKSIKTGVMDWCDRTWPNAEWPNAIAKKEHPCDAAVTGHALLMSPSHQRMMLSEAPPDVVCSWD